MNLLESVLSTSGRQLRAAYSGLPESLAETKVIEGGMTPAQMLEHVSEAYMAFIAKADGREHQWGSYRAEDRSFDGLRAEAFRLRDQAVAVALSRGDDEQLAEAAVDYLALHDAYHVGQICALRVAHDPAFDPHSIYR